METRLTTSEFGIRSVLLKRGQSWYKMHTFVKQGYELQPEVYSQEIVPWKSYLHFTTFLFLNQAALNWASTLTIHKISSKSKPKWKRTAKKNKENFKYKSYVIQKCHYVRRSFASWLPLPFQKLNQSTYSRSYTKIISESTSVCASTEIQFNGKSYLEENVKQLMKSWEEKYCSHLQNVLITEGN